MHSRLQRTIARPAEFHGFGFLTGADVALRFLPADEGTGIRFQRVDLPGTKPIPATLAHVVPRQRRTAISNGAATVELIEHVMAALAGLQIDNCRVELNGPELPGGDGSSQMFADCLLEAGLQTLDERREVCTVPVTLDLQLAEPGLAISVQPNSQPGLRISYELDYGTESCIPAQSLTVDVTSAIFLNEIVFARTFILEAEARAFQAQGMGQRLTFQDLLVYGPQGVIDNELRAPNECVRHKILDCIGDFALLGCDLSAHVICRRTGHRQNAELVRAIRHQQCGEAQGFRDAA